MRTVKDLRAALTPGATVQVENLCHPRLSGPRIVLRAQTTKVCLSFPPGHPKRNPEGPAHDRDGSWLDFPKRDEVTFDGDTATLLSGGQPWLHLTVSA